MTPEQIEEFREWCRSYKTNVMRPELGTKYAKAAEASDEDIEEAVEIARDWIRGRRWSTTIVAANFLIDGYCHPR